MSSDNNQNILGYNSDNNKFVSDAVVPNAEGSIIERLASLQSDSVAYNSSNYLAVPITFVAGTTGTVATHELFTVTGLVKIKIIAEVTVNVAGTGSIQLGTEDTTDAIIAVTAGTDLDAEELWYDATPTTKIDTTTTVILDKIVNAADIGYEISVGTLTSGAITFHCWYTPLNATGAVVASDGLSALV
jgi:hypothetical protein